MKNHRRSSRTRRTTTPITVKKPTKKTLTLKDQKNSTSHHAANPNFLCKEMTKPSLKVAAALCGTSMSDHSTLTYASLLNIYDHLFLANQKLQRSGYNTRETYSKVHAKDFIQKIPNEVQLYEEATAYMKGSKTAPHHNNFNMSNEVEVQGLQRQISFLYAVVCGKCLLSKPIHGMKASILETSCWFGFGNAWVTYPGFRQKNKECKQVRR
jgi:hypothetical protein